MLSEEMLQQLSKILVKDFGKRLDKKDLVKTAGILLDCFDLLTKVKNRKSHKNKNYYENDYENQHHGD